MLKLKLDILEFLSSIDFYLPHILRSNPTERLEYSRGPTNQLKTIFKQKQNKKTKKNKKKKTKTNKLTKKKNF